MLESASFNRAVHATLVRGTLFPPPASSAMVLPRLHRTSAGRAADAGVTQIIERMVRHVVRTDIIPHLIFSPVGQGVDLHNAAMVMVEFDFANVGAGGPLIATEPRHPGVKMVERPAER